jgi:hypothetical protein
VIPVDFDEMNVAELERGRGFRRALAVHEGTGN